MAWIGATWPLTLSSTLSWLLCANCKCVSKVQLMPILSLAAHWQDDTQLLTASADRSAALWDTSTGTQLSCFAGHFGGIKTLSTMPGNEAVFATGEATWLLSAGHE